MHDFDYDVMQKKRIASGAVHRKRGSKSKKCTLPSDFLSKKELKAMNGEVKTYNIHERMDWRTFKSLPEDVAKAHINWLVETFGCNAGAMAECFGVTVPPVRQWLQDHDMKLPYRRFMTSKEWLTFLGKMLVVVPDEHVVIDMDIQDDANSDTKKGGVHMHLDKLSDLSNACKIFSGDLSLRGSKTAMLLKMFEILPDDVTALRVAFEVDEVEEEANNGHHPM